MSSRASLSSSPSSAADSSSAPLGGLPGPPPSSYRATQSRDRPSSSSSSSSAGATGSVGLSSTGSHTLPRKLGKLLQLATPSTDNDRQRQQTRQINIHDIQRSDTIGRLAVEAKAGDRADGPWRISCANGTDPARIVLYGQSYPSQTDTQTTTHNTPSAHDLHLSIRPPSVIRRTCSSPSMGAFEVQLGRALDRLGGARRSHCQSPRLTVLVLFRLDQHPLARTTTRCSEQSAN